jgi:hypothetical protein
MTEVPNLDGWIPIRLYSRAGQPIIDWCHFGRERFTDPFFTQTIQERLRLPFNLLFRHQTSIDMLRGRSELRPGLPPSGFIFHMSRCGSTLITQMLASMSRNIVISEAGVVDSVIRSTFSNSNVTDDHRIAWLRWLVSALAQPRLGDEKHFFIKFDAWNTIDLPLIRRAFPLVPWIFVYRDPAEVLVSQLRQRGAQMVPGVIDPALFGMDILTAITMSQEEYCARVLGTVCETALRELPNGGRLVNYNELPEAIWDKLLEFFSLSCTADELGKMHATARLDAKNPGNVFTDDTEKKRNSATGAIREMTEQWCYPVYEQLEAARLTDVSSTDYS